MIPSDVKFYIHRPYSSPPKFTVQLQKFYSFNPPAHDVAVSPQRQWRPGRHRHRPRMRIVLHCQPRLLPRRRMQHHTGHQGPSPIASSSQTGSQNSGVWNYPNKNLGSIYIYTYYIIHFTTLTATRVLVTLLRMTFLSNWKQKMERYQPIYLYVYVFVKITVCYIFILSVKFL